MPELPKGNTYQITIGPYDKIEVTVELPDDKDIKTVTLIKPIGMRLEYLSDSPKEGVKCVMDFSTEDITQDHKKKVKNESIQTIQIRYLPNTRACQTWL